MDYGMERCMFNASIPTGAMHSDPAVTLTDPTEVEVWRLNSASTELTPHDPTTWTHAPIRRDLLTTLVFSRVSDSHSAEFACPSGEFTTVELACRRDDAMGCHVDFWQDPETAPGGMSYSRRHDLAPVLNIPPHIGLVITQMQSLGK